MRKLAAISLYPATILAGLSLAYVLLYLWQWPVVSIAIPLGLAFVVIGFAERLQPYRTDWNRAQGDVLTDTIYIVVNLIVREGINVTGKITLVAAIAWLAHTTDGAGTDFWPQHWPIALQIVLAIVIFDFFEYWYHRASHQYRFLWRFHAIHHSAKRLYFFNAARFHLVDWVILSIIEFAVLFALGAPAELIALCIVFIQTHGLFQHSNIGIKLGPLNYLVSGPELHRWHHSKIIRESDTNFGNNVIVWDLLFGTYFLPKTRQVGELGLLNPNYPHNYWGQLKAAFAKKPLDKPSIGKPPD